MTPTAFPSLPAGYRAVVIGAGGGIGSALARRIAADPRCAALFAATRDGRDTGVGTALACDICDAASLANAAQTVSSGGSVDVLIVASGLLHQADVVQPEKSWRAIDGSVFASLFAVNATGPMLAVQAFLPAMPRTSRALIGILGARVGSVSDNRLGGWYGYRASKAALAMLIRTLGIELARTHPHLTALMLHPGTVDTVLSEPFRTGAGQRLSPDESALALIAVLDGASAAWSGDHRDWRGELVLP